MSGVIETIERAHAVEIELLELRRLAKRLDVLDRGEPSGRSSTERQLPELR